ncbi:MAG: 2Fe-2S iron-sulfur cluster-binding protein [Microvirga sp.]
MASSYTLGERFERFVKEQAQKSRYSNASEGSGIASSPSQAIDSAEPRRVIHVVDHTGERHTIEALEGWRVMEIIRDWKLPMEGICGGACECATCHVFVGEAWLARLPPASEEEEGQLDMAPLTQRNSRLACQILWTPELDGLEVTLAPVRG